MIQTPIKNKAVTPAKRETACNAARRLLQLSREAELEGPLADVCRGLAHDAMTVAERELTDEERAMIQRKIDTVKTVLEVKA